MGAYEAQISLIFAKLLDNRGLLRANLLDFWVLGIENLLDNSKSPGYSEHIKREIPRHLGTYEARQSRIFANLLGYLGPRVSTKGQVGQYCTIVLALASVPL